jgi:predicted enzyme related to lactoylglutathione lyase
MRRLALQLQVSVDGLVAGPNGELDWVVGSLGGKEVTMLRGMSTVNLWADDLPAATRWYTELLGVEPYFSSEAAGRGPGYVEFRIGDYQHELGIIDRRFAPAGLAAGPGGALVYWDVDDVAATLDRLVSLGAKQLEALTERGPGFVTASVVDPSATSWASVQPPLSRRPGQPRMTSSPAAAQRLRGLAWLRRVRDRIDREYARPLDLQALARGAHMSAGHLSRRLRGRRSACRHHQPLQPAERHDRQAPAPETMIGRIPKGE